MLKRGLLAPFLLCIGCATAPKITAQDYRPNFLPIKGPATPVPVALMVTAPDRAASPFLVHNFYEQAGKVFSDRTVVYQEAAAGDRALVVIDSLAFRMDQGFFDGQHVMTIKGFVKRHGGQPVRVEVLQAVQEDVGTLAKLEWGGGLVLSLGSVVAIPVPFVLAPFYGGQQLLAQYTAKQSAERQLAMDVVSSAAINKFLNAAGEQLAALPPEQAPAAAAAPPSAPPVPAPVAQEAAPTTEQTSPPNSAPTAKPTGKKK